MDFLNYRYNTERKCNVECSSSLKRAIESGVFKQLRQDFGSGIDYLTIILTLNSSNGYGKGGLGFALQDGLSLNENFEVCFENIGEFECTLYIQNVNSLSPIIDIEKELDEHENVKIWLKYHNDEYLEALRAKVKSIDFLVSADNTSCAGIYLNKYEYTIWDWFDIKISKSLKKVIMEGVLKQLKHEFGYGVDQKVIYLSFENDLKNHPLLPHKTERVSFSPDFKIGYYSPYVFLCTLYLRNGINNEYILNLDEELKDTENIQVWYEMDENQKQGLSKRINEVNIWNKVSVIPDYNYPVKVISGGIDSTLKVQFSQVLPVEEKRKFFDTLEDKRTFYNEREDNEHQGIIHSMEVEKGLTRSGNNMSFILDLGSAGEPGLKYILKVIQDTNMPVEYMEIR